ncbi:2-oxoglutarate dehydrogenase [Candidatus Gottesmanbacteria bacterium RBG_13_45_10]|uniref:2-oxoglutarate dehydrogenase n=1 Tax=Candidatus Gottesmanbacteria bacterium RBG_13_45_10 TaxID=1798370 RepID=A0A1F5ZHQ4_9BACT|nr:MAG: 2-oxoglutarate dehydrogenase [Candidatus Gottesmanbacteria bacterium RBG_13_45_10]
MKYLSKKNVLYIAFAQALVATLGSLYFSEIRHFPPCTLCWYQRITMYPLVTMLAVGIVQKDKNVPLYVLPLSLIGLVIALYQNLLSYGILPEAIAPCQIGVSCTTKYIGWFGFITIPLLSFVAFFVITLCMLIYRKGEKS